jgi:hypothetical protein
MMAEDLGAGENALTQLSVGVSDLRRREVGRLADV